MPWLLITDVGFHQDQRIHIKTTLGRFKHLPRSEALHRIPHGFRKKSCTWIFIQLCYTAGNEQLSRESKIFLLQIFKNAKKKTNTFSFLALQNPQPSIWSSCCQEHSPEHPSHSVQSPTTGGSCSPQPFLVVAYPPTRESVNLYNHRQGKAEKNECFLLPKALDFGLVCCEFL